MQDIDIEKIKPYPNNAKLHPKKQIQKIADSIREFGFNQPLVIDTNNMIIIGHGRWEAAKVLGMTKVPTLTVSISEEKAKAYRLADNKLNESEWDMGLVIEELRGLSEPLLGLTGFDQDLVLDTEEDEYNIPTGKETRSQMGDLYELGDHRLLCGDSTLEDDYRKLFGAEKARMIFTDPPYSVDYVSGSGLSYDSERFGGTGGKIFNDDKSPEEALAFYTDTLKQMREFSTDDATLYWWHASRLFDVNLDAWRASGWHMSQVCIWLKNAMIYSPGQLYHRIYEPCMVGWKEGLSHYKDTLFSAYTELWNLDKRSFQDYLNCWYEKRDNTMQYIHPTQKPVALAERAIKRSSEKGDIVFDGFGGSGSTMMACEQLGRKGYLIELDPKYVDAIVQRYVDYVNAPIVKANGKIITWEKTPTKGKKKSKTKAETKVGIT